MTKHVISRFLIVCDDEEANAKWRSYLGKLRYDGVTIQTNAEEALEVIEPKRIQFIIVFWERNANERLDFCQSS